MIQVIDSKDELDRSSGIRTPGFVVARINNSSEEEEDEMFLNRKRGSRELLADRAKGSRLRTLRGLSLLFLFPLLILL